MEAVPVTAFEWICSTCLTYSDKDLYPIAEVEMEHDNLIEILSCHLPLYLQIDKHDRMPQNMCKRCVLKIYELHRFLKNCKNSLEYLWSVLKADQQEQTETVVIKAEGRITITSKEHTSTDSLCSADEILSTPELCDANSHSGLKCGIVYSHSGRSLLINNANSFKRDSINLCNETPSDTSGKQADCNNIKYWFTAVQYSNNLNIEEYRDHFSGDRFAKEIPEMELVDSGISKLPRTHTMPGHKCEVCSEILHTVKQLQAHWIKNDHFPEKCRCHYCQRGFKSTHQLEYHIRTHTGERPYVCDICGQTFSHPSTHRRHKVVHTGERRLTCGECGKTFTRRQFLVDHERRFHNGDKLLCHYCGKGFWRSSELSVHAAKHIQSKLKMDPKIPFQCNVCGKILATQEVLDRHKKHHVKEKNGSKMQLQDSGSKTKAKQLYCTHCNTDFNNWEQLKQHKLNSECSKFFEHHKCEICGKFSFSKTTLYDHLKVHKDEAENITYNCRICGQEFKMRSRYRYHLSMHTKRRRHMCAECGFIFYTKRDLVNHKRVHTGEKPFICSICNKSFSFKSNMFQHQKLHTTDKKTCQCEVCGILLSVTALKKHKKSRHKGTEQ